MLRQTALGRGAVTALGTFTVSVAAAIAGVILAREFGRTAETDGLFAAYSLYLAIVLVAQASRIVVLPRLARAAEGSRLGSELATLAVAVGFVAVPILVVAFMAADWLAGLLTANEVAREVAADAIGWMVLAGVAHLLAALVVSALAARDSYGTAALGYAVGSLVTLIYFALNLEDGPGALATGLAIGGATLLAVPSVALLVRGHLEWPTISGTGRRLGELAKGVSLPLALQGLYVISLRFAAELGVGAQTTFSYAYFFSSVLVAVTASSLALISSVPLTRAGLGGEDAARHVVSTSWVSLSVVAAAAGVFVLAGEQIARGILGDAFAGSAGEELGELVAILSVFMIASIGVSVTLPLLFVAERDRFLVAVALGSLAFHAVLTWALQEAWGMSGIAIGLGLTTLTVLAILLELISRETLVRAAPGLAELTVYIGLLTVAAFGIASIAIDGVPAALVGLALYTAAFLLWRPRGLRTAWAYVRALS